MLLANSWILVVAMVLVAAPVLAEVDETVVVCDRHDVILTARGDIAIVNKLRQVEIQLPILHEEQLIQNDSKALVLTAAKKRIGVVLSRQKVMIDYKSGVGFAEDLSTGAFQESKKIQLKSCRRFR